MAAGLAGRLQARLIGVGAAQMAIPVYAPFGEGFVSLQPEVIEAARKQVHGLISAAESTFRKAAEGNADLEWRGSEAADSAAFVVEQARAADLVVVSRPATSKDDDLNMGVTPSDIVMGAGRPVLVLSPASDHVSFKRIVVAWKDTREARRAIAAAMPLLIAADEVFVTAIGEETPTESVQDVCAHLAAHGATVKGVNEIDATGGPAAALVRVAQRVDADLIVSGAFGHSRMREWAFGGVTRDLLETAPVAVLFNH
jgi:nucleotide-binding universal stress UspA family protein